MLSQSVRALIVITPLAAILFLPLAVLAQDDKDAEIERLKKDNAILEQQLKATKDRLLKEIDSLNKTIKEREVAIVELEAAVKRYRSELVQAEALAKIRPLENEMLQEQIRKLEAKLARMDKREGQRDPAAPNPPQVKVDGKIEKIDGDLVLVSLGTDHGVNKDNTLDVYRTAPAPKYLGMIRIIDANHDKSVGRLIPTGNAAFRAKLKEGDLVTSDLRRVEKPKEEPPKDLKKLPAGLKGVVQRIDPKDATLVTISLGSDAGLEKGHTLEVYGFRPEAKHLGSIRIIEATPQSAIARRLGSEALEVGDEVVSK